MAALFFALALVMSTAASSAKLAVEDVGHRISVIVSKLDPADHSVEGAVERMGGSVGQELGIVDGFEAQLPESAVPRLAQVPGVRGITTNNTVRVESQYGENSGVASAVYADVTRASKAWGQGTTGKGITVALIDTGVDVSGDLAGRVIGAADFSGENAPFTDSYGHGTFVAGLIAGTGAGSSGAVKGMAPDANIFSVKIAGKDGSTNIFRLLAALEFVAMHRDAFGIRVLNLSLGSDSTQSYLTDPLNFAVERVWNSGIVVVAAAGNSGKIVKPADDPLVVTVGAADDKTTLSRTDDIIAGFSGVGPTLSNNLAKPDIVTSGRSVVSSRAPGSTVETNFPNASIGSRYLKGSGTSASSAIVAGAAALVIQKSWNLSPNQVKYRLAGSARPLVGATAMQQGAGSIDAFNAVVSTDTASANQGVTLAGGGGSFQSSSGSYCFRSAETGQCVSDAEVFSTTGFDPAAFYGSGWAGQSWNGSGWAGSGWASQWTGSGWAGSGWASNGWTGSGWAGNAWEGSGWAGSGWAGSGWASLAWSGSGWAGSGWAGSGWAGSGWAGSGWAGSGWAGSGWAGSGWAGSGWAGSGWAGSGWAGSGWQSELSWLSSHWY